MQHIPLRFARACTMLWSLDPAGGPGKQDAGHGGWCGQEGLRCVPELNDCSEASLPAGGFWVQYFGEAESLVL